MTRSCSRPAAALLLLVVAAACATRPEAPQPWLEVKTEHIHLVASSHPEIALEMAERLELFHQIGRELLSLDTSEERARTKVFVLDDALWYDELDASQAARGWLYQHPLGNYVIVQGLSQREEALRFAQNLYTRVLQQTRQTRALPRWYDVGISELLSTVEVRDDHVLIGRVSRYRRGLLERGFRSRDQRGPQRGIRLRGTWVPLRRVATAVDEHGWTDERRSMFYAEAWALTFFLVRKHPEQLASYLQQMSRGRPHDAAFEDAFGVSHLIMEEKLERFFRGRERLWRLPREHLTLASRARVESLDEASRELLLGELLLTRRDEPAKASAAEGRFSRALELDENLAGAHAGLALALAIQGKPGGDENVRRALELAPDDARIHLLAGEFFTTRARETPPFDRAQLERARGEFERAIELEPDLVSAHHLLGYTYTFPGEDAAIGVAHLERAHTLMSWQHDIALALGEAYLRAGRQRDSVRLLERVKRGAYNEGNRQRAEELLSEIDVASPPLPLGE